MPLTGKKKRKYARKYYLKNRKEILAKTKAYLLAHPEVEQRSRKNRIFKEHDISAEEYEKKLREQSGKCAICGRKDTRALSVDHDHTHCAGEKSCRLCNRGLLCNKCNKKLAALEELKWKEKAEKYLQNWKKKLGQT